MTVRELIEELQQQNQELEVFFVSEGGIAPHHQSVGNVTNGTLCKHWIGDYRDVPIVRISE